MSDIVHRLEGVCRELERLQLWSLLKEAEYVKKELTKGIVENEELRSLFTFVDPNPLEIDEGGQNS